MSDLMTVAQILQPLLFAVAGITFAAGHVVKHHHQGRASRRAVEFEGMARLIRAQRGDAEPLVVQVTQLPPAIRPSRKSDVPEERPAPKE